MEGCSVAAEWSAFSPTECRDVLLALLILRPAPAADPEVDDNSENKPDHEASSQLLSYLPGGFWTEGCGEFKSPCVEHSSCWSRGGGRNSCAALLHPRQLRNLAVPTLEVFRGFSCGRTTQANLGLGRSACHEALLADFLASSLTITEVSLGTFQKMSELCVGL